jgi:hypothetical protein
MPIPPPRLPQCKVDCSLSAALADGGAENAARSRASKKASLTLEPDWRPDGLCTALASGLASASSGSDASAAGAATFEYGFVQNTTPSTCTPTAMPPPLLQEPPPVSAAGCGATGATSIVTSVTHSWASIHQTLRDDCSTIGGYRRIDDVPPGELTVSFRIVGVLPSNRPPITDAGAADAGLTDTDGGKPLPLPYCYTNHLGTVLESGTFRRVSFLFPDAQAIQCQLADPKSIHWCELCSNGKDDDNDGLIDCCDPDCASECPKTPVENCTNGLDDDCDGKTDCLDPDCASAQACLPPEAGQSPVVTSTRSPVVTSTSTKKDASADAD